MTKIVIEGTPWWATLLGYAVSGLLGAGAVILGQRIAANRDDARWTRERDREAERWRREDDRQWLVDRREAYAALYAAVESWHAFLTEAWGAWKVGGRVDADFWDKSRAVRAEFEAARGLVNLLAPEPIRAMTRAVNASLVTVGVHLTMNDTTEHDISQAREWMSRRRQALLSALREDLGIVDDKPPAEEPPPPAAT